MSERRPVITPSPHPPNWPDCDPDDPTPPPTTEELVGEEGHHIPPPVPPVQTSLLEPEPGPARGTSPAKAAFLVRIAFPLSRPCRRDPCAAGSFACGRAPPKIHSDVRTT